MALQTLLTTLLLLIICIYIHYELLMRLSMLLAAINIHHRIKVFWAFCGVLGCHLIEITLFAAYYQVFAQYSESSGLTMISGDQFTDFLYYSFVIYTSLGLGDIVPIGDLRLVTGLESLIGLLLIAWSASFMFFQMELYWKDR